MTSDKNVAELRVSSSDIDSACSLANIAARAIAFTTHYNGGSYVLNMHLELDESPVISVFHCQVRCATDVSRIVHLLVYVGDIPSWCCPYSGEKGVRALVNTYTKHMQQWVDRINHNSASETTRDDIYIDAEPTSENADMLQARINVLNKYIND